MRMQSLAILLTLAIAGTNPADADAAYADWQRLGKGHYAYATVSTEPSEQAKERMGRQLAFVCASFSSKPNLGDQLPVRLPGTDVYRLDLEGLGWAQVWPHVLVAKYPYRPDLTQHGRYPLVVMASWLVGEIPDPTLSGNAQQLFLYGRELKTVDEFTRFWNVNTSKTQLFSFIEGASGVQAKNQQRLMNNSDTSQRTRFFQTFDSIIVAGKNDPLENLVPGTLKFDGSELIVGIPKYYRSEGGALQAYLLGNAQGKVVNRAPIELVKDTENFRGGDIINSLDCMNCHATGMKFPTVNEYRSYLTRGGKVFAKDHVKREIERVYESPFVKELERQEEDYAIAIRLVNGLTPERNISEFRGCVESYDAAVTLSQAAREVGYSKADLRAAIVNYSPKLTGRLVDLAYGQPISRDQWKLNIKKLICEILPARHK
jgi:hypothetical protein